MNLIRVILSNNLGLDPAEPHFTFSDPDTRLDSSDADFVDIIHTDGSDFKGFAGKRLNRFRRFADVNIILSFVGKCLYPFLV